MGQVVYHSAVTTDTEQINILALFSLSISDALGRLGTLNLRIMGQVVYHGLATGIAPFYVFVIYLPTIVAGF